MTSQELGDLMLKVLKEIKNLSSNMDIKSNLEIPSIMKYQSGVTIVVEICLSFDGYMTRDRFNNTMSISESDTDKIAVALLSSMFHDYFKAKSLLGKTE
jgi:hypothetical protein